MVAITKAHSLYGVLSDLEEWHLVNSSPMNLRVSCKEIKKRKEKKSKAKQRKEKEKKEKERKEKKRLRTASEGHSTRTQAYLKKKDLMI